VEAVTAAVRLSWSRSAARAVVAFVALSLLPVAGSQLQAQPAKAPDYEVKAAYLFNFSRFVTWPPATPAQGNLFSVCVLGSDPFGRALRNTLAGESVDGKSVVARTIRNPQDALGCRILFLSASEDSRVPAILEGLGQAGVLTVSDVPSFIARGGMIQFVYEGRNVRFEVNLTAAERAGLALSADLLRVAVKVTKTPAPKV
jgi:hypothetical protein